MKQSIIRTLVPIVYALLIHWGFASWGIGNAVVENLATVVSTGLVYIAIRFAETHKQYFGWLLGYPSPPKYTPKHLGEHVRQDGGFFVDHYLALVIFSLMIAFLMAVMNWYIAIGLFIFSGVASTVIHLYRTRRHLTPSGR